MEHNHHAIDAFGEISKSAWADALLLEWWECYQGLWPWCWASKLSKLLLMDIAIFKGIYSRTKPNRAHSED